MSRVDSQRAGPLVTVIIPTRDRAGTIERAVRSVLGQTLGNLEIVVVDDGSTDGTRAVVESIDDRRLRYLFLEENRGAAGARNAGIEASAGTYIAFLDSDDEWLSEKLRTQIDGLEGSSGASAACSGYFLADDAPEANRRQVKPPTPESWLGELLMGCRLSPGATLLARRDAFDEIGLFDEAYPRYEDWDWLLRYASRHPLVVSEEPLAVVYRNPRRPSAAEVEESALLLVSKRAEEFGALGPAYRRRALAQLLLEVAWYHYGELHLMRGTRYLLRAIAQSPAQIGRAALARTWDGGRM